MAGPLLRLIHAASVQLDVPLQGLGPLPRDLLDVASTATLTAWERLVDAAVAHDVDALLLTADTFDASSASLPGDVALRLGLERLADKQIPVFITPGQTDPYSAWQELPDLPHNTTVFDSPWDAAVELSDRGKLKAVLCPVSAETDISPPELATLQAARRPSNEGQPVMVGLLWTGSAPTSGKPGSAARAAAFASLDLLLAPLGQEPLPLTEAQVRRQASPQGMTAAATGPHGATLLEFDTQRRLTTKPVVLGPVRRERLVCRIDHARNRDDLLDRMLAQLEELPAVPGELLRMVQWEFQGSRESFERLKWDDAAAEDAAETLTETTDQPGRLRMRHRAVPFWQVAVDDSHHSELWRDYLQLLDQQPAVTADDLRKHAQELRPQQALAQGAWERWLQQLDPAAVQQRARGSARRWFANA